MVPCGDVVGVVGGSYVTVGVVGMGLAMTVISLELPVLLASSEALIAGLPLAIMLSGVLCVAL